MHWKYKTVDFANLVTIVVTFILFALALFTEGLPHNLFLEIGVFLVSVKLILAVQKLKYILKDIAQKLEKR